MEDIVQAFDASLKRVLEARRADRDFFDAFYDRFLASSERVAEKFRHTDMARQKSMLRKSFYYLVTFYASGQVSDYMVSVARAHSRLGHDIPPDLYDLWLETLISVVRDYDYAMDDDVELAWRLVLVPGITYMQFMYERVRP